MKIYLPWIIDIDTEYDWKRGEETARLFRKFAPDQWVDVGGKCGLCGRLLYPAPEAIGWIHMGSPMRGRCYRREDYPDLISEEECKSYNLHLTS